MKILQIFGAVVAVHLLAFIFIFASPGCQSGARPIPTPDATVATAEPSPTVTFGSALPDPGPAYPAVAHPGRAEPTRPGSPQAVALAPAPPVAEVAHVANYTVQRGDSLWSISRKHQLTVGELAKANHLPVGATLQPGQKLLVPTKAGAPAAAAPKDLATASAAAPAVATPAKIARPANGEPVRHTVQPGESLGIIARKYDVRVGELAAANSITDPSKVRAGQQLVIPGYSRPGTAAKPAAAAASAPPPDVPAAAEDAPAEAVKFELAPPPPGQDLDAGLPTPAAEGPTVPVEPTTPPKS